MASASTPDDPEKSKNHSDRKSKSPDWANGLRQLYDSVVDEPIPDSFQDLLNQLDKGDGGQTG